AGTGIGGVSVNLLDAGGAVLATVNTTADGYYLFTGLAPGTYTVELAVSNFIGAGALVGFTSSTGTWGNLPPFPYEPGAGGSTDADDNGTLTGGAIRSGPITLVSGGAPTGEPATPGIPNPSSDANSDLTVDFGVVRPASIGDRIWNDINHNGVQDAGEVGIPGVTVSLYDGSGNLIARVTTDANGNYIFPNLQPGASYEIRLDNDADYGPGGPLDGFRPTLSDRGGDNTLDSDAVLPNNTTPIGAGNYPTIPVNVGGAGSYTPTFDAGFWQPLSLGNRVWNDLNNNGLDDDGAGTGIGGVRVNLLDAGGALLTFATTTADGYYLFNELLPGTYTVELDPSNFATGVLVGFTSSTGTAGATTGPFEPGNNGANDNNDNGSISAGGIRSNAITLTLGTAPTGETATPGLPNLASDANSNLTVDFGVFQPLSLGNQVWHDQNNNGVVDGGETGIANVTVNLLDASGNLIAQTTTNAQGYFLFTNLGAGSYVVELPAANFTGPLAGYSSSSGSAGSQTGPYEPGNSGANDNNDNGSTSGGGVRSDVIVLTPGSAPSGEAPVAGLPDPASDTNSNRTIDFGVFQPLSLGNRVWNDPNNNGLIDAGESGVANVAMQLLDAGGAVVATTQTNAQGYYLFTNLLPGTYSVRIAPSNFAVGGPLVDYISSTGNGGGSGATNPGPYEPGSGGGVDDNDNGSGTANLAISGITSAPTTLALGGTPTGEPATPGLTDPAADINSDVTIDFGVFLNPTAIGLVSFTAVRDGSDVKLSWTTSVEVDTAGFYLYRSADRTRANAVRITPSLLAARGDGGGATYSWTDTAPLETGYYWLQEVEVEGATQDYGPVAVQQPGGSRILLPIIRR
ncbi:MAG TPA: SdrD B-like domain-containing protein, partial [Roseiflexaceae bacterium]|nr:SdrD B-like domain-containing protein [Roseiflexaceae bacterium]